MKTFEENFLTVTSLDSLMALEGQIIKAHGVMQKCEAGADASVDDRIQAIFAFLVTMGFYPTRMSTYDVSDEPLSYILATDGDHYGIVFEDAEGARTPLFPLLGPHQKYPWQTELNMDEIMNVINKAFPKASLTLSETDALDGEFIHHVTWREEFLPPNSEIAPNGSASCSTMEVALMQAAIRLAHAVVIETIAAEGYLLEDGHRRSMKQDRRAGKSPLFTYPYQQSFMDCAELEKRIMLAIADKENGYAQFAEEIKRREEESKRQQEDQKLIDSIFGNGFTMTGRYQKE